MRMVFNLVLFLLSVCGTSVALATAYYAGGDSRNDCYAYVQGDSSAPCVYSASPDAACAYYGSILSAEGQGFPQYYPYYAEESLNNSCYRANGTQVTVTWHENSNLICTDGDSDGQCDTAEEICADGFPANADPRGCDRPTLSQCQDGSFIEAGIGICPVYIPPCTDRQTCFEYSKMQVACSQNQVYLPFEYYSPTNFTLTCTDVDPTSADHPNNGGNLDGNPYNDPTSEPEPEDYWYIAQQTGQQVQSEQQEQLADIERAIREGNEAADANLAQVSETISSVGSQAHSDSQSLEGAVTSGADRTVTELGFVIDRLDTMNGNASSDSDAEQGILATISDTLSFIYEEIKRLGEIFSPDLSSADTDALGDLVTSHVEGLQDEAESSLMEAIQDKIDNRELSEETLSDAQVYVEELFPNTGPCQPLKFGTPDKPFYIEITCEAVAKTRELFSVAIYFFTAIALMNILLTGVSPKVSGGEY